MKKSFAKLMAVVVALCLLVTTLSLPTVAFADTWDGSSVSASIAGEGTEEAPYLIASAADLAFFAADVNGGNDYQGKFITLTDDIDLNNSAFSPIGSTDAYFKGTFDGAGHTVSGLNISSDSNKGIGFFGAAHLAKILNLNVRGNVTCTSRIVAVAGLVGKANNVTITNCSFDGTVRCGNTLTSNGSGGWDINDMNYLSASGLVCEVTGGAVMIDRCVVAGTIVGFGRGGSFVGSVNGAYTVVITNSYSIADVTVDDNGYTYNYRAGGGLIGFLNTGTINMNNCYYYGTGLEARSTGMGGPIINHLAGGTFNCTKTYYNSDKNAAEPAAYERGEGKTEAEFADGTVTALLNGDAETPIFEQGEKYPVFYVEKCDHSDVSENWETDEAEHWHICDLCGKPVDAAAHTASDWIIDKPSTEQETGLKHKECTVCGYVLNEQVIPVYNPYAWDGSVSESLKGEGTEESPYIITNGSELAYFAAQVNAGNGYSGKYIELVDDIDLNDIPFTPIGTGSISGSIITISDSSNCFKGMFNGDNHTISGLNVDTGADVSAGLFGAAYDATIKNLNVEGRVKGTRGDYYLPVGGLVGCANNLVISGCSFDGTVESTNTNQNAVSAAGLVSTVTGGTLMVDRCSVSGKIIGFGRSGGILGQVNGGFVVTIKNSFCDAEVTGIYEGYEGASPTAGGIIGFLNSGTITVKDSFFAGTAPTARASGMAGPIINHCAGGVFSCINTYYDSDKNAAESDGNEYGEPATSEEFANGTVLALLNGDAETPIFEQGEKYPILIVKCEHRNTQSFEEIPATCVEVGHKAYTICNDCGEVIDGEDAEIPVNADNHAGKTEIKGAKSATCTEAGYTGDTYCADCGAKIGTGEAIKALGHKKASAVKENVKEATYKAAGSYESVVKCSVCKKELSRTKVTIPMKVGTFKITYALNGGKNNAKNPKTFKSNTTVTLKNPTKNGYTFKGWYTDAKFTKKITKITKGTAKNLKIYAKWSIVTYKLTYKLNGGKNGKNPKSYKVTTKTFALKAATRKGYTFKGWYLDSKFKKKVAKIAKGTTGNKTLYAKWVKKK